MKKLGFCMAAALILISCTDYDVDELLDAPEQVNIGAYTFDLSASILDQAPFASGLSATVHIATIDSSYFPSWLDANEVWVIDGENVWHDELTDCISYLIPWLSTKVNQNTGPQWNAGIYVDVVVQLIDDSDNLYLIKQGDVYIVPC